MTVPVQIPLNQIIIVGGETLIPWTWNLQDENEIIVTVLRALDDSIDTLTLDTDYTVEANDLDVDNGGNITPIGDESPVTAGDIWTMSRDSSLNRAENFATSGAFFAVTINEQLDELTRIAQDSALDADSAVRKNPAVGDTLDPLIPQPVDRRALIFSEVSAGNFELIMSTGDPDDTATSAAEAAQSATESAVSAAEAAQSATEADDSAQSVANQQALYATVLPVSINTILTSVQNGFLIKVDTSGGSIDITLPDSSGLTQDFRVGIQRDTSDTNVVNVKVAGSDTVNGATADIVQDVQFRIIDYVLDQSEASYTASPIPTGLYGTVVNAQSEPVYSGESFSVTSQDTAPTGLAFNSDGTKMFMIGNLNDTVFEYTLSVGFDLSSTVTFTGNSFSVASEEANPVGIAFNSDGTKFFIVGNVADTVFEYTLSVGFDLSSTVAFSGNSFSVASEDTSPTDIIFNSDGTKFFMVGTTNDTVFEYTLSVGFDLSSTVTFTGNSFDVSSQETDPHDVVFNSDGTKFFIVGNATDTVFEYTLSVGFDLSSSVAFSGNSFSVASEESIPLALAFNTDGTKFFIAGNTNDTVFEYFLPAAFDLSVAVAFANKSFSVASEETSPTALAFNTDGTKFFIVGATNDTVFEYTVSVGFDLSSTVAFSGNSFSVASEATVPSGLAFNSDGTKFFIVGSGNDTVFEYTVSVGFDLSSTVAFSGNSFSVASEDTVPRAIAFNTNGTKFFIMGDANNTVFEYTVSVGFDLSSTVAFSGNSFSVASEDTNPAGIAFNIDGTKLFIVGQSNDTVFEYTVSVGFDLSSTVAFSGNSFSVDSEDTSSRAIAFNIDGTKFLMVGQTNDTVFEYNLRNAFNVFNGVLIDSSQDGFLFLAIAGATDLNVQLPKTADVSNGFRIGITKITSAAGDIVVNVENIEDINLASSITLATQFKNALCSADVDSNRYFADVG